MDLFSDIQLKKHQGPQKVLPKEDYASSLTMKRLDDGFIANMRAHGHRVDVEDETMTLYYSPIKK